MRQLSYFVFTSGEEGVRGLDWGIKFASSGLGDHRELDSRYRKLLDEFKLSPSLERPDSGVGILLLPFRANLLLYIFPGHDRLNRLNTAAIACNVPIEIASSMSVREVSRRIWSANDLAGISRHGADRPDVLNFPDEAAESGEYPFFTPSSLLTWPSEHQGYLSLNGSVRELERREVVSQVSEPESETESNPKPHPKFKWVIAAILVAVIGAGTWMMMPDTQPEVTSTQGVRQETKSDEHTNANDNNSVVSNTNTENNDSGSKTPPETPKPKPLEKPFAVNRDMLIAELRKLYAEQKSGQGKPRIRGNNALEFVSDGTELNLDWKSIFSGGTDSDKNLFITDLNQKIKFHDEDNRHYVRITFWNTDPVQRGKPFDEYLGIFVDQAMEHFKPIDGR